MIVASSLESASISGNVDMKDGQEASANHSIFDTITGRN